MTGRSEQSGDLPEDQPEDRAGDAAYLAPYREAIDVFGAGFEATLWADRRTQLLRFDVMLEMVDLAGRKLVDAGCGAGDLAGYLIERRVPFAHYIGIDGVADQIAAAQAHSYPHCEFRTADLVHEHALLDAIDPDIIIISGTLNTMDEHTARTIIEHAFRAAREAVIFNFLSDRPHPRYLEMKLGPARRFDTARWIDWALGLTPCVAFRQDYLDGHDATVLLRHAPGEE